MNAISIPEGASATLEAARLADVASTHGARRRSRRPHHGARWWRGISILLVIYGHLRDFRYWGGGSLSSPLPIRRYAGDARCGHLLRDQRLHHHDAWRCASAKRSDEFSPTAFYIRRVLRIIPPYFLYLLCILVLSAYGAIAQTAGADPDGRGLCLQSAARRIAAISPVTRGASPTKSNTICVFPLVFLCFAGSIRAIARWLLIALMGLPVFRYALNLGHVWYLLCHAALLGLVHLHRRIDGGVCGSAAAAHHETLRALCLARSSRRSRSPAVARYHFARAPRHAAPGEAANAARPDARTRVRCVAGDRFRVRQELDHSLAQFSATSVPRHDFLQPVSLAAALHAQPCPRSRRAVVELCAADAGLRRAVVLPHRTTLHPSRQTHHRDATRQFLARPFPWRVAFARLDAHRSVRDALNARARHSQSLCENVTCLALATVEEFVLSTVNSSTLIWQTRRKAGTQSLRSPGSSKTLDSGVAGGRVPARALSLIPFHPGSLRRHVRRIREQGVR